MTKNGDYELSDVPKLMERGDPGSLLRARQALMDGCEALMKRADTEARAMTGEERRTFDLYAQQIRGINADFAEYKRERIAGLMAMGIDGSEARFPF